MIIGVNYYCENETCKVEIYSCSIDEVSEGQTNCPACGQFGRTKGREPSQSSRSIGLPEPQAGRRKIKDQPQA